MVGGGLRDVLGLSGENIVEAYMMSRVRKVCVFKVFARSVANVVKT